MFGIEGGFDVVIGNPPYLESRHPAFGDELKDKYQLAALQRWGNDATSITRGSDLLIYFFEHGISSINENGCVVLLAQNSWLDTEYGKKFQNFLLKNTQVKKIVDSDYRYFISGEGPNINTVITLFIGKKPQTNSAITFARYHENFQQMSSQSLMLTGSEEKDSVDVHRYNNGNALLQNLKWGILLASPDEILNMLELLKQKAIHIEKIKLTFGQGLNLCKDYVIDESTLSKMSFAKEAAVPFLTSDDGAVFYVSQTHQYILDKSKLSKAEVQQLQSKGINLFDPSSTTKTPPKLIMPRGISRHFCAFNGINCYSSSFVDVYSLDENISDTVILNLWLFFNSSICWLLREISGRKNLGGGMLKAEAVDLDSFPVYMEFGKTKEIESILEKIKKRQALNTIQEIETEEHKIIDKIVFDHLGISNLHGKFIISTLKEKIIGREKKATT